MTAPDGGGDGRSRAAGPLSLVADPTFRKLWSIGVLMGAMRWLEMLAVGVWTYDQTQSAVMTAVLTMLRMAPMALFGSVTGVMADRVDRKYLLVGSLSLMALTAGCLAISAYAGTLTLWQVGIGAFLSGLGWSTDFPVRRTILGETVGPARLGAAMSMDSASNNATRMIGPIAGGGLYATIGMQGIFTVSGVVFAIAVLLAVLVVYRPIAREPRPFALIAEIREGLRYLRRSRALVGHLGITVIVNMFAFPYASMIPVVGKETFGVDAVLTGLLLSVEGAGAFAGAMTVAFLAAPERFWRIYLLGSCLLIVSVFVLSFQTDYAMALIVLAVGGIGISGFASMQSTIMFSEAPPEIRSRLMGILSVCIGAGPLGVMHVGWLADWLGASMALTVISLEGMVAMVLLVIAVPELRR
ncbi:MAG: MFS transporter [Thalassobaculaceae bacterium]|nr:MFS transporter [Thalassobaculaceae bacterium]